ncbi:hypothetical protein J7M07_06330 [bacterium]|nr:hypothetical protein [bacterium]
MDKINLLHSVIPSGQSWKEKRLKDMDKRKNAPEKKKKDDSNLDNGEHIDRRV